MDTLEWPQQRQREGRGEGGKGEPFAEMGTTLKSAQFSGAYQTPLPASNRLSVGDQIFFIDFISINISRQTGHRSRCKIPVTSSQTCTKLKQLPAKYILGLGNSISIKLSSLLMWNIMMILSE